MNFPGQPMVNSRPMMPPLQQPPSPGNHQGAPPPAQTPPSQPQVPFVTRPMAAEAGAGTSASLSSLAKTVDQTGALPDRTFRPFKAGASNALHNGECAL